MGDVVPIDEQIACVERELRFRRKTYPRLVRSRQLTQVLADKELERMEAVLGTLTRVKDAGPRQVVQGTTR